MAADREVYDAQRRGEVVAQVEEQQHDGVQRQVEDELWAGGDMGVGQHMTLYDTGTFEAVCRAILPGPDHTGNKGTGQQGRAQEVCGC